MRTRLLQSTSLSLILLAAGVGCDPRGAFGPQHDLVTARDLAGTYSGVLQGVTVASLDDLDDPARHVIVDLDLLHELRIRAAGDFTIRIESDVIPPLRALVAGIGPVAVNAQLVELENLAWSDGALQFDGLKVKQIVFVRHEHEWIVVLQLVRVGFESQESVDEVYVYQYVSYPAALARQMSEDEAIRYVNTILRLLSAARRS